MNNLQLQNGLFKAAKVGHIELMRHFIKYGADPFALDESGHDAFFYAEQEAPEEAAALLKELQRNRGTENA